MAVITQDDLYYAAQYIYNCLGGPYVPWYSGYVSPGEGPPAWGINEPPPRASRVRNEGAFCAAVANLMHRYLDLKIPNPYGDQNYDGGIVSYWEAYYSSSEWFDVNTHYPDGTFVMSPYNSEALGDQGHIAMIWHYADIPYCMEWIMSDGGTWNYTLEESNQWGNYQIAIRPQAWVPLAGGSFDAKGEPEKPRPPEGLEYPGDLADPDLVARWMARVAKEEYSLPPELPVMTSYVELTAAWTGPGDVKTVPGYWTSQDYDSLGYFQQRAGWGSVDQRRDATYALHAFLNEAEKYKYQFDPNDPEQLGEWCAEVQRPREDLRYLYYEKGYAPTVKLIKGWDQGGEPVPPEPVQWPEKEVRVSLDNWAYILEGDERVWLKGPVGYVFEGDKEGWLQRIGGAAPDAWREAVEREPDHVMFRITKDGKVELKDGTVMSQEEFEKEYIVEEK